MFYLMTCESRLVIAQLCTFSNAAGKNSTSAEKQRLRLFTLKGGEDVAGTASITVLTQINTLPGT
jgi:hypothetical protein